MAGRRAHHDELAEDRGVQRDRPVPPAGSDGPRGVQDADELAERLAVIREQGYALQDEEVAAGLRSISVPVFGRDPRPTAAVNIAVSTQRHDVASLRGPLLDRLRETADDISVRLRSA